MYLSSQTIRKIQPVTPFLERTISHGMSRGLSTAGYDIAVKENRIISPHEFQLVSSVERFKMPKNVIGFVKDKSTWARKGLAVQNTVIEPGWEGYLTLELTNHGYETIYLEENMAIAQVVFAFLDEESENPYTGKYQNQKQGPQVAIYENIS